MSSSPEQFAVEARKRADEIRRQETQRYEGLVRQRFAQAYPNPSPEQQAKTEARIRSLVEKNGPTFGPGQSLDPFVARQFESRLRRELIVRGFSPEEAGRTVHRAVFRKRDQLLKLSVAQDVERLSRAQERPEYQRNHSLNQSHGF
jgi:hypothetical protein